MTAGDSSCPVCASTASGPLGIVVHRSATAVLLLPYRQRSRGAGLVVPLRHAPSLTELTDDETRDLFCLGLGFAQRVEEVLDPDGLHFWVDNGQVAGQVTEHVWLEVVPRYAGVDYSYIPWDEVAAAAEREVSMLVDLLSS